MRKLWIAGMVALSSLAHAKSVALAGGSEPKPWRFLR